MIEQGDFTPFTLGTNPIRSIQATREFLQKARPLYRHMLHTAAEACRGSDLLIHGLPTIWGAHIAEGLGIPAVRANLQPLAPTREFPSALLPFRFSLSRLRKLALTLDRDSSHLAFVALRDQPRASRGLWAGSRPLA
jgi:hypothetical protein